MITDVAEKPGYSFSYPLKQEKKKVFSAYETGKTAKSYNSSGVPVFVILPEDISIAEVILIYAEYPQFDFLPVIDAAGKLCGYVKKKELHARLSVSKYSRELMMRPEIKIDTVMDKRIITVDAHTNLSDTSRLLMERHEEIRFDSFVITLKNSILGIANVRDIMDGLNYYMASDLRAIASTQSRLCLNVMRNDADILFDKYIKQLNEGVGGDYIDFFSLNQSLHMALHFDVVGKGIKAFSMVMAIGSIFKSLVTFDGNMENADIKYKFSEKIRQINRLLYDITPEEMYATGSIAIIDTANNLLKLYDFGQGMFWLKRNSKIHTLAHPADISGEIPFLGINRDISPQYLIYKLQRGDVLFSASDGVIETKNHDKEYYGSGRIVNLLAKTEYKEIYSVLLDDLEQFRNGYRFTDDLSFYTIKI